MSIEETKRRGRPLGTGAPPEEQRKVCTVRLNAARRAKLKRLGSEWLENAIDKAPEPKQT